MSGLLHLAALQQQDAPYTAGGDRRASVPIFDISSKSPSPRASEAINSDMVKPMPQSQLAPKIWLQVTDAGRDPSRQETPAGQTR